MTEKNEASVQETTPAISFSEFLESTQPGVVTAIDGLTKARYYNSGGISGYGLSTPEIQLHCSHDACNGVRFFRPAPNSSVDITDSTYKYLYLSYTCSNCQKSEKTFSLAATRNKGDESGKCYKFGELPQYGPPTPARLIKLIGPDREMFLKGRRCENLGLGIGAFVYYRRVVETQKNRILDEILKVSHKIGATPEQLKKLEAAKTETQFSKALSEVKDALPQSLLVNGHNPLALLHSALSEGLHGQSDEHCLEVASSVRIVLGELSERLAQALKDEAELNRALSKLIAKNG